MRNRAFPVGIAISSLLLTLPVQAQTTSTNGKLWQFASGTGNILFLGVGLARPLLGTGKDRWERTGRGLDALAVSSLLTQGLKDLTHEERPDHSSRDSFPSGHASAAFTVAMMESQYHRREAPLWFLGAALIGDSRIRLNRHYPHDVLAGAAIGYGTARIELSQPNGLLTAPFIQRDAQGRWISFSVHF